MGNHYNHWGLGFPVGCSAWSYLYPYRRVDMQAVFSLQWSGQMGSCKILRMKKSATTNLPLHQCMHAATRKPPAMARDSMAVRLRVPHNI